MRFKQQKFHPSELVKAEWTGPFEVVCSGCLRRDVVREERRLICECGSVQCYIKHIGLPS